MTEKRLNIGAIIASRETYGDECLLWKYYRIIGYTKTRVRIQEIKGITTYDDGIDGPHYYDAPAHIHPAKCNGDFVPVDAPKLRSYRFSKYDGSMIIKTDEFFTSYGEWNGQPLETYSYH